MGRARETLIAKQNEESIRKIYRMVLKNKWDIAIDIETDYYISFVLTKNRTDSISYSDFVQHISLYIYPEDE